MSKKSDPGLDQSFAAALKAAADAPDNDDAWDHLEELAGKLDRPDEVADLFRKTLERRLPKELTNRLGERAVAFHQEWFGDDPDAVTNLLSAIIERDVDAEWAFDRLTVALTAGERWDTLLAVYDSTLVSLRDPERRKRLLDDAAQVAKDFASQPARAADYLTELLKLDPRNDKLETTLARLLERQERWGDLVELWRGQLRDAGPTASLAIRVKIARCCLDQLAAPTRALEELDLLLTENPGAAAGCAEVERVLDVEAATNQDRQRAVALLRRHYDAARRPDDVVRVLVRSLGFVDAAEQASLHREIGSRLAILGRDEAAIEHYGELMRADPSDTDARRQVRQLARRSRRDDLHALLLERAADSCSDDAERNSLLLEAARLHHETLADPERAGSLYARILEHEEADNQVALTAAHSLNELLAAAGRAEERLSILERISRLEPSRVVQRFVLGDVGRLAAELGDTDRALASWRRRIELDETDREALDAVVELLATTERWPELVDALQARAATPVLAQQRRADLVRAAELQESSLADLDAATESWLSIRAEFGDDDESLTALDRLMTARGRFADLVDLLAKAATAGRAGCGARLVRVADVYANELAEPIAALDFYEQAAAMNPAAETARAGLTRLLEVDACRPRASTALARAYEALGDRRALLELLDVRLTCSASDASRGALLREAAGLLEHEFDDAAGAHERLCQGIVVDPTSRLIETELVRVAEATSRWAETAEALRRAAAAAESAPPRAAELSLLAGELLETRLQDPAAATDAYLLATALAPRGIVGHESVARCAALVGRWQTAVGAFLAALHLRERLDDGPLRDLEAGAIAHDGFPALAAALQDALATSGGEMDRSLARTLHLRVGEWFQRGGREDAAREAARRAVALDPTHPESLGMLVELQRESPSAALVDTLLRVDALSEGSLDALREAGEVALEHADREIARQTLVRLYRKAARMWARAERGSGEHTPSATAIWALERIVELYDKAGDTEEAVRMLLDGASLPLDASEARELRRRAAERLVDRGLRARAIDLYASILSSAGDDLGLLTRAAELCEQDQRIGELLALRQRELEITGDAPRRLELRLEISRLGGLMEARGGRVDALLANLEDLPGHPPTIAALTAILVERGQHDRLMSILEEQAARVTTRAGTGEGAEAGRKLAADLWAEVGRLAVEVTGEPERAIAAYTRVVELEPRAEALDALSQLQLGVGAAGEAARWLEVRLASASASERVAVLLRLARARLRADEVTRAIEALESAFADAPRNGEIRKLLVKLHRDRADWPALARVLSAAACHVGDAATVLAYAREAASIYRDRLGQPEMAVPVLEKALGIANDDRELRSMLAEGLRVAGRLDEARALLVELVDGFGRRRSPERADAHLQLARVLGDQGEIAAAIDQLEVASSMDAGNLLILKTLGELARRDGQFDRAERAYRTLLVQLRRAPAEDLASAKTGPCTTLLELARIARDRGQEDKSQELVESALEALSENDSEAERVQELLRAQGDLALLRRVLDARLAWVEAPHLLGRLHAALADLMATNDDDPQRVLDARLAAVEADPATPALHDAAQQIAEELGRRDRYRALLERLLEANRRSGEAHMRCELALRLGFELERQDDQLDQLDRAAELYALAQESGVRQVDVWRAMARLAGARGDKQLQVQLLEQLASLGADQSETRADALYRMAEVHLATPDALAAGLDALRRALADSPQYPRAARILERAADKVENSADLFELYEEVARRAADPKVMLEFFARNLRRAEAPLDHAREAVETASRLGDEDRAENFMLRAVELAEEVIDGKGVVAWALLKLAERRRSVGDLAGAVKWLGEATDHASLGELLDVADKVAESAAAPLGDLTLAAKMYERLKERDGANRRIWEPLARIYTQLGDIDALERMVDETLDGLETTNARNSLRVLLAGALLSRRGREDAAVEILRGALMEAPDDADAQRLLVGHLEATGDVAGLVDLLRNQLMSAQARGSVEEVRLLSVQLIERVREDDRQEAVAICRSALESAPEDPKLLRMTLELEGDELDAHERIELLQRLLAVETAERAPKLTVELVALCEAAEDAEGAARALAIGYGRAPTDRDLRARLQASYRERGDFEGLARTLVDSADAAEERADTLDLLREAARVQVELLHSPHAAVELLQRCCELAPDDVDARVELAEALSAGLQHADALDTLTRHLATLDPTAPERLQLLRARAAISADAGDTDSALADLEAIALFDLAAVLDVLEAALESKRAEAREGGDAGRERELAMRLVDLAARTQRPSLARERLSAWIDRDPDDVAGWQRLRILCAADEDWEAVARCCERLIACDEGDVAADAALGLVEACARLGRPEAARAGLEAVYAREPGRAELRAQLRGIYEAIGANSELARLLLDDVEAVDDAEAKLEALRRASALLTTTTDLELAITTLTRILAIDPEDKLSIALLADTYVATNELDAADELLDATIAGYRVARSPELSSFQHRKARVAQARGDRQAQLEFLKAAFAADKENGPAVAELALLAEELEDWDLATRVLRAITVFEGPCPISRAAAFLRQGLISYRTGDVKRAVFWARRARQEDPNFADAQAFLDEVAGQ